MVEPIVAIEVLLLVHVPPEVVLANNVVAPTNALLGPVILVKTGAELICTVVVT